MRKMHMVLMFAAAMVATTAQAEQLEYGVFKVYGEVTIPPVDMTLVITRNPSMAIVVLRRGPKTIRQIAAKAMTDCRKMDQDFESRLRLTAPKFASIANQMDVARKMGAEIQGKNAESYVMAKSFAEFAVAAEDKPYYQCGELPKQ